MRRAIGLAAAVATGLAIALATDLDVDSLPDTQAYLLLTAALLGVGLYGSTSGIDLALARTDRKLIFTAVTVGVVVKALIIGVALALAFWNPLFLLLGVVTAQIDPLSVASLMNEERLSPRARTILAAWSSFDDPITVVLTVYAATIAAGFIGTGDSGGGAAAAYVLDVALNLLLAGATWAVWWLLRRYRPRLAELPAVQATLLAVAILVGIAFFLMLGIALIGLFLRPAWLTRWLPVITESALFGAAGLLGVLLVHGISPLQGAYALALGVASFGAQIVVGWWLTRRLPPTDRWHLAFAQQNGITAIILALRLESQFAGVAAVVGPAIVVTNLVHHFANRALDRREAAPAAPVADEA